MGKACIRYRRAEDIPFDLLGELASKMTVQRWMTLCESNVKDARRESASA